jgi:aminoglycoside 6'-N-acetyltransferase
MSFGFHRGGFENVVPVRGVQTLLRPVEASDVQLLLAWHADPEIARYWDWERFTRETMLERLARPDVTPYLVLADGDAVGYLQVWSDATGGGIDMFLEPSARGRGLGPDAARAIAEHLVDERGWPRVTVDPYAWNEQALHAWRKAGFVEVSRHDVDDEHTDPWVLLEFSPYPSRA